MHRTSRFVGLTAAEFARRWGMSERRASLFLRAFERVGFAERLPDGRWRPTEKARDAGLLAFADAA